MEIDVTGKGPTYVSGNISNDTVYTKEGSPYILTGDVIVKRNATLIIEPGAEIRFDGCYTLTINRPIVINYP